MRQELELWQLVASRLANDESLILLIVAESTGSSPGRAGYKMAVAADGEMCGSIGGGVMEVELAEAAKLRIENGELRIGAEIIEQVHRKDVQNSSGMICSGRQTVIVKQFDSNDLDSVNQIIACIEQQKPAALEISNLKFQVIENTQDSSPFYFSKVNDAEFAYQEKIGCKNNLFIVGGGHCALALSELMSRLDFRIHIFDDRPELNTIAKNRFADEITIIGDYAKITEFVPSGDSVYVVVMTLGFVSDETVIRSLINKSFKYFGVLGSKAKMAILINELRHEGLPAEKLDEIRTPIGVPINSHSPHEIAVSIAAELIAVKNG